MKRSVRKAKKSMRRNMRKMAKSSMKSRGPKKTKKTRRNKAKKSKKKGRKPPSAWNKHMMMVYKSMKAKDASVKLGDAMKAAKKTYKKTGNTRPLSMSVD
tara:strand:- start:110 stop:409 length:300 start_codon:yes stop_codon:yes gene_type:complete